MNRRHFLMGAAAAAGSLRASSLESPNDTVRVACVGLRGQGRGHMMAYSRMPNVEIAALCDIDERILKDRLDVAERTTKRRPAGFTDLRKLLEDRSIDAVSIATPNHGHTLQAIWAMQAGKDVYVEKPCCHNMFECKQLVAAQKRYGRIVQHGTQSRSGPAIQEAVKQMRAGLIGEVYLARGLCFKWRDTIGRKPVAPVPAGRSLRSVAGPRAGAPVHRRTGSTTTGTGSGTTATAISATRAFTRSTWRAGVSASPIPRRSRPWAVTSCSTTIRRPPTP